MHYSSIARMDLGGANPQSRFEIRGDYEVLVRIVTGRDRMVLTDVYDAIGSAQLPAFGEDGRLRQVAPIALGCAVLHPRLDGLDFGGGEARIIGEMFEAR